MSVHIYDQCVSVPTEQLNKIDEDMMKLHEAKLRILRAIQGVRIDTTHQTKEEPSSKGIIFDTIEQGKLLWSYTWCQCCISGEYNPLICLLHTI